MALDQDDDPELEDHWLTDSELESKRQRVLEKSYSPKAHPPRPESSRKSTLQIPIRLPNVARPHQPGQESNRYPDIPPDS